MTRLLLIDNYDSFTYNLAQGLAAAGATVEVVHNDASVSLDGFDGAVISPGPGRPDRSADFGACGDVIRTATVPLLGVCLGHQGICEVFGGAVGQAPEPYHGRASPVWHDGDELFDGIPSPFRAVRYHSLAVTRVPESLRVIATAGPGLPMAVRHNDRPIWGVQFHPESIGTEYGQRLLDNFVKVVMRRSWQVRWRRLESRADAEAIFDAWYGESEYAFWLDSSGGGRFSFLGAPSRVASASVGDGTVTVDGVTRPGSLYDWLRRDLDRHRVASAGLPFEFALGWVGYLGYELGSPGKHASPYPDAFLQFADRAVAFDHHTGAVYLLALAPAGDAADAEAWLDDAAARLAEVPAMAGPGAFAGTLGAAVARHGRAEYLRLIEACQAEIQAGESYEICLTNMISVYGELDPWPAYRVLRRRQPVPYGAYLRFGDLAVLSCSPERFLRIGADRTVESRPIKGTRPRGATPAADAALRADLAASEKDRAENLMIVDLVRNDLGSVAETGSVTVPGLFEVETFASVHQLVSTVRGRLAPGVHPVDCVRAAFPGGSMTGAPKIRTMEIIDALEDGYRGVYSGSIGYFSLAGGADLSITIRT
ncbi:MAG TPA: aminodeoxychorismate synthase component I, partial [Streptosporangiaceae bacterium]|nr:aminodeoxychorismate synthase component I [Streptosporangiaceae bacterium]